jgi:hypothetical protein
MIRTISIMSLSVSLASCSAGVIQHPETVQVVETPISAAAITANTPSYVKDEQAAIDIALKTWIPVYGKEAIDGETPYIAGLKNGVWHVQGSLPKGWDGGVAEAWISQKDGRVIKFIHGK